MNRALASFCLALAACSTDPPRESYAGTLEIEVTRTAEVALERRAGAYHASLTLNDDVYGSAEVGVPLTAVARIESFPEAGMTMTNASFELPPRAGARCGAEPTTLALSLIRRGENARVAGALTVYCGAHRAIPAEVLRLSGDLPRR